MQINRVSTIRIIEIISYQYRLFLYFVEREYLCTNHLSNKQHFNTTIRYMKLYFIYL